MEDIADSEATMKDEGLVEPDDLPEKKSTTPASGKAKKKAAKPTPRVSPKVATGEYVVEQGDHPWAVGEKLYGEGTMGREIVLKNPGVHWNPGDILKLP